MAQQVCHLAGCERLYLQTYMGHKDWEATAYYIHLLPEKLVKSAGIDWEAMNRLIPRVELWEK